MKKMFFLFLINFKIIAGFGQSITLDETRNLYAKSTQDKETCQLLYSRLSVTETNNNVLLSGYYGAVAANMANHTPKPADKIKMFNLGRRLLEKAIVTDSTNLELRFLRFTIQSNAPKALHYDKQLQADKDFIISHFESGYNSGFRKKMAAYLATSKSFSPSEKEKLRAVLARD